MTFPQNRQTLARQQAELVQALSGLKDVPSGFDPVSFETARESLLSKRMRALARSWPGLVQALGEKFQEVFFHYAVSSPLPSEGGPLADGFALARTLKRSGKLSDQARLEMLAVEIRYVCGPRGLKPRRGPAIKWAFLKQPRKLVIAFRLPWLGEKWMNIPLGY